MTDQSSIFPAFIRAEYDPSGNGFSLFEKEAGESAARTRRQFEANFAEVERVVNGALSRALKPSGAMDLGVSGFRQAAAQARAYEQSLRTMRDAAQQLAVSTGDTSASTRSYLQALSAQVLEANRATQAADAQVTTYSRLQAELDATASRNTALAASYREVHLEQARSVNAAHYAQQGYNKLVAPALTQSATSNGAGYGALEAQLERQQALVRELNAGVAELEQRFAREATEQARAAEQATAALARRTQALEEMRRAEAGAANGAAMLSAIMRDTGAGASSGASAAASASAFEQHFAEQARAAERYAQEAARLRAELDPMYLAQQRFDREMDRADDLLKAGAISTREYAQAQAQARANLQAHSSAIHAQVDGFQQLARGSGVLRQAYIQTGQQSQDLVISLMGGQKASVVFAQQLPQLAFALSGLGMQADGTQKGIGRIATLLSGPWGVAFAGAAFAVGLLVEKLWQQDEAGKAAEDAAKKHKAAIDSLNEAMERSVQTAEDKARADFVALESERIATIAVRERTKAELEKAKVLAQNAQAQNTATFGVGGAGTGAAALYITQVAELEKRLAENQQALDRLTANTTRARGQYQMEILEQQATPEGRAKRRWDNQINDAITGGASAKELERLRAARDAELAKIRETEQALKSSGSSREREAATVNQVSKMLIGAFGGTITSTTGGKHVKGSYHYKGQAVDFVPAGGIGSVTKAQIRAAAEAAGLTIKELLGPGDKGHNDHFHLAWSGGKNEINSQRITDQLAREAERRAAEAQRLAEELDRAAQSLFSRFDEGRAAALDYSDALAEIDRVLKAGLISPDDAMAYGIAAAQQKAANDNERNQRAMDQMDKDLWGDKKRPAEQFMEDQRAAWERSVEAAREIARQMDIGLGAVAEAFGNDFARILDRLSGYAGAGSGLGSLLSGVGAGNDFFFTKLSKGISGGLESIFGKDNLSKIGKTLGEAMGAASLGSSAGGLILGGANSQLGSSIGGAIGNKIGEKVLGKGLESIAKGLGDFAGPLGSIAGGLIGGALGGLFKKTYYGSATVTGQGADDIRTSGNKPGYKANSKLAAGSIQSGLAAIAEQLGADIGGYNVAIGQFDGKWRVNTQGRGGKMDFKGNSAQGLVNFGKNGAEDAIKFAIADAVKDGALLGLRASTQTLLTKTDDIEAQLQKALDFEGVFTRLKEYRDPVGAALDTLDKEFTRLQKIFKEAGASAEEYAQLEELYGIERAEAVKEAGEKITASLKSLFDELTVGNDARSLRERLAAAQANYSPLAQRVASGDITAYDDYSDAARTLLDIQRQISGSGEDYFKLLDQVTALTKTRIDAESNVSSIAAGRESIFTQSAESMAPVVSATEQQTAQLSKVFAAGMEGLGFKIDTMNTNLMRVALSGVSVRAGEVSLAAGRKNF